MCIYPYQMSTESRSMFFTWLAVLWCKQCISWREKDRVNSSSQPVWKPESLHITHTFYSSFFLFTKKMLWGVKKRSQKNGYLVHVWHFHSKSISFSFHFTFSFWTTHKRGEKPTTLLLIYILPIFYRKNHKRYPYSLIMIIIDTTYRPTDQDER